MYCELCRVAYPSSYTYCPSHGSRLTVRQTDTGPQCPSCGSLSHQQSGFCGNCGANLIETPDLRENGRAKNETASSANAEPESLKIPQQNRTCFSSALKKTINDDLTEAFSSLDPRETPWFALDFDADFVAVTPYGVTVATIVDPGAIDKATVYKSLFPEGPWLLTMADGTDLPLDNPIVNAKRAMRAFEDKLTAFFRQQRKTFQTIGVNGLIVFPDGYDLKHANEPYTLAEGSAGVRVINAGDLPNELLKPAQQARVDPELLREWLNTTVLRSRDDDSIALTWLDPNGETISNRVRTLTAQKAPKDHRAHPPRSSPVSRQPTNARAEPKPKTRFGIVVALCLALVAGSIAYWDVYAPTVRLSQGFLARHVLGKNGRTPEVWQPTETSPVTEAKRTAAPGDSDSSRSQNSHGSSDGDGLPENTMGDGQAASAVSPAVKSSPDVNTPLKTASQKKVEDEIDKAIHRRAVNGVYVAFVNDTAYLTGSVLSEKQKAAAEEAARKVRGVKRVQSSISVKWQTG
jgi:hypothetical protein